MLAEYFCKNWGNSYPENIHDGEEGGIDKDLDILAEELKSFSQSIEKIFFWSHLK